MTIYCPEEPPQAFAGIFVECAHSAAERSAIGIAAAAFLLLAGMPGLACTPPASAETAQLVEGAGDPEAARWEFKGDKLVVGNFTILDRIQEDRADRQRALQNAADSLVKHPDLDAIVGIWAYNAQQCFQVINKAKMQGKLRVFAFDEDPETLKRVVNGTCEGAIVQTPYEMGFLAIEKLKTFAVDGISLQEPDRTLVRTRCQTITQDSWPAYREHLKAVRRALIQPKEADQPKGAPKFVLITDVEDPWWGRARAGCLDAARKLNVVVSFLPNASCDAPGQNKLLEQALEDDSVEGVAVSPINPAAQAGILNRIAAKKPLITVGLDAPESNRILHIGTDTYESGRMMGRLMKERMPEGGKVIIYVGVLDQLNAQRRCHGLIDELMAN